MRISDWSSDVCSSDLLRLPIGIVAHCKPWASPVHRGAPMDFYTILAPGTVAGCSCGHRHRDILGPAIVGAGAYSPFRQVDRVEADVWDPLYCLPKIEKVITPATPTPNPATSEDR